MSLFKKRIAQFFGLKTAQQKTDELVAAYIKNIPALREAATAQGIIGGNEIGFPDGKVVGQMYDFYTNYNNQITQNIIGFNANSDSNKSDDLPKDTRKVVTPLSVMNELEKVPTPFSLEGLDEKIETLKDKSKMVNQRFAKAQIDGLCKRLENRKKYTENIEFWNSFPYTTDEKIDALLAKYKLKIDTSELFIPTFPKEAIDIMKQYSKAVKELCDETPVYYVIAEEKDFAKKREKLDPILLVQSPFSFSWQILGAWDAEMLLLGEL